MGWGVFRKRPVEIQAFRWTGSLSCVPDDVETGLFAIEGTTAVVTTPEGALRAPAGHWILRGVKGELRPCAPDAFEATHDEVGGLEYVVAGPNAAGERQEVRVCANDAIDAAVVASSFGVLHEIEEVYPAAAANPDDMPDVAARGSS